MEAASFLALAVVPVFFNPYSFRIFAADKTALLQSLALFAALAGGMKWISGMRARSRGRTIQDASGYDAGGRFLLGAVLLYLVTILASSALSIIPRVSFQGSYERLQGVYTTLAYIVLLLSVGSVMKTAYQRERMVILIILTSLPVCIYAVFQKFGVDPLALLKDVTPRVVSTLGNPLFLSSYLMMIIPLTLRQVVSSFRLSLTLIYTLILLLQLYAMYLTGSRCPVLGLGVGLLFLLLFHARLTANRKWIVLSFVLLLCFGLFVFMVPLVSSMAPLPDNLYWVASNTSWIPNKTAAGYAF